MILNFISEGDFEISFDAGRLPFYILKWIAWRIAQNQTRHKYFRWIGKYFQRNPIFDFHLAVTFGPQFGSSQLFILFCFFFCVFADQTTSWVVRTRLLWNSSFITLCWNYYVYSNFSSPFFMTTAKGYEKVEGNKVFCLFKNKKKSASKTFSFDHYVCYVSFSHHRLLEHPS